MSIPDKSIRAFVEERQLQNMPELREGPVSRYFISVVVGLSFTIVPARVSRRRDAVSDICDKDSASDSDSGSGSGSDSLRPTVLISRKVFVDTFLGAWGWVVYCSTH